MVKHVNVAIDDDLYGRAQAVKDAHDLTWEQFMERAIEELEAAEGDT